MGKNDDRGARPNLYFALTAPDGTEVFPIRSDGSDGRWRWGREKFENNLNLIQWVKGRKGWTPYYKIFADEQKERQVETIWFHKEVGSNRTAMRELKMLFGGEKNFNTPKPISLVERIVEICTLENSIVLDCFAGSGTTAQAVMNMNKKDGGKRKFILIESENFIENITVERVRRVAQGYSGISGTGGDFSFYEMGESLFNNQRMLNESIDIEKIREYIWYMETRQDYKNNLPESLGKYFLGTNQGTDYYFFYEKDDTTILNFDFLSTLQKIASAYVIFADVCTIDEKELMRLNISFKKIPRDISKL